MHLLVHVVIRDTAVGGGGGGGGQRSNSAPSVSVCTATYFRPGYDISSSLHINLTNEDFRYKSLQQSPSCEPDIR
jgi:hypothetical protein